MCKRNQDVLEPGRFWWVCTDSWIAGNPVVFTGALPCFSVERVPANFAETMSAGRMTKRNQEAGPTKIARVQGELDWRK